MNKGCRLLFLFVIGVMSPARSGESTSGAPGARPSQVSTPSSTRAETAVLQEEPVLELLFTYGSEKKKWVEDITPRFNAEAHKLPSGERIRVKTVAIGSGELIDEALSGRRQSHLVSPAASTFIQRGNSESRESGKGDLIGPTRDLVSSPIVVAMWRDMAEAIGWPGRNPRWHEIFEYARKPERWEQVANPEWGPFKFGHTHPEFSNSGLHTLFAETYAALGKFDNVNRRDVTTEVDKVSRYIREVESAVDHYGSSTGFLADSMFGEGGRNYLSAAVLYENLVIEANQSGHRDAGGLPRIVAIYPADGTFPCNHPAGVVSRPWVTEKHRAAAAIYVDYLLERPQQELALKYGFRPSDPSIDTKGLLTPENGADPAQPKKNLEPPPASVIRFILDAWRVSKRHADIVLAIDTSASMMGDKIKNAEEAAKSFIRQFSANDTLSTMIFGADVEWMTKGRLMDADGIREAVQSIDKLEPDGDTALYNAIDSARRFLEDRDPKRIRAIVILSDGKDTKRNLALNDIIERLKIDSKNDPIFVFTIGYGTDADADALKQISESTKASYYEGKVDNIRKVFTDIATFF
jgi:Ca-activated chloride channel family protein